MSVVPVQALQGEGALVSGDLDSLARCAAFLSARAGVPISASRLIAALGDGREATGELDFDGLAQAMRRGGLALEKIAVSIAGLGAAHLPALVIDPEAETGVRVLGLTSRGKGGGLEVTGFGPHAPAGIPIALDAFATAYPGELWRVAPLAPAGRREEEHEGSVGRDWFWSVFREELGTYVHVGAAAVIINVLALVTSLYTMTVYDRVIPNHALVTLWTLSAGVAIAYVFDFVFRTLRGLMLDVAARRMDVTVSRDLFEHLLAMRLEHRRGGAGTTANMLREYATVQEFFSSATLLALVDLPFVILFLGVLFVIAPACAFATAAAIPIVAVAGYLIQRKIAASSAESFADGQEKHGALVETLVSLEAVRGLGAERAMRRRWRERVAAHAVTGSHMRFYSLLAVNVSVSVQQFAGLVVVLAGVLAIHAGTMSMGALVAAVMLSSRALAPLASLAQIMSRAALTKTAMKAITAFMDTPSERPAGRKFVDRPQLQGQIEARDLSFHYPARTPVAVLQDLNLTIRPGERVGILGRIGSGKSTLLKLMMGLYQPTEGAVYHDGVDLRQLDPAQLRAQVAFVAQAPVLFSGTIKENIAIARPEATDAEILAAAQVAGVDAFVSRHPMGYDLPVQERGEGLSIGQRQAIALAQALLKGADVLLLDEPTSAFDESTEAGFRRTLLPWLAGKTLVIVTHKLSMLELVERVILVDGGRIVMDGPKEAVLRALMNNEEGRPVDQTEAERIAQEAQRRVREAQQPEPAAAAAQAEPAAATDPDESLRSGIRAAIVTPTEAEAAVAPTRVEAVIAAVEAEVVVAAVEAEAIVEPTELAPRRGALGPPRLDWRSSLETES